MKKVISIILNYNCADKTACLVKRIQEIESVVTDIIVVDNQSTDNSLALLSRLKNIRLIKSHRNLGFAGGNNLGIRKALAIGAEYLLLINPDVSWDIPFVSKLVNDLDNCSDIALASPLQVSSNGDVNAGIKVNLGSLNLIQPIQTRSNEKKHYAVDSVVGAFMLVRSEAILKAGLIPEAYFLNFEETEWNLNIQKFGYQVCVFPEYKVNHEVHGSISSVSGLNEYYIRRNAVRFNIRNGNLHTTSRYLLVGGIRTILSAIRYRDFKRVRAFLDGLIGVDKHGNYISNVKKVIV